MKGDSNIGKLKSHHFNKTTNMKLEIGMTVKWNDPGINDYPEDEREFQQSRTFEILDIINDDVVLIADEYGEAEVLVSELDYIT